MIILKLILCFLILILMPTILGLLITKFMEEKNNIILSFVIGYVIEFSIFELIYLPMYFIGCSFKIVKCFYLLVILALLVLSIYFNKKRFKDIFKYSIKNIKEFPKIIILFLIILSIQVYMPVRYMQHIDPDDAFYLGTCTTTIETNSMFHIIPYSGEEYTSRPLRYSLSGLVIYFSILSEILHIHPAILLHTVWPAIAIPLEFIVYALIGNKLLKNNKEKLSYFLIFLSTIYMFGFISIYTNFSFFAYRSWQGKSLIANLIIPMVWLLYLYCIENSKRVVYWINFLLVMISSCFVTEMGVFLVPVEVGVLSIISFIRERKLVNFIKFIACCTPQIMIGILYIFLK